MKVLLVLLLIFPIADAYSQTNRKVFDVHLHGSPDRASQLVELRAAGVYKAAISTSWELQNSYQGDSTLQILFGLMFPCPNGKVPYSLQDCYSDQKEWPPVKWVEEQIAAGKIDYFGEVLNQYYGISASDSLLFTYYALAEKYNIPVGIHTGGAGPNHGSPNFKMEFGNPVFLKEVLQKFPRLKLWIMHSGDQFYKETIDLMRTNKKVYADISVISNPAIVPAAHFATIMKAFIAAGLEDRLLFGTDNGDVKSIIRSVEKLSSLTEKQKQKIFYQNAEAFFSVNNP